MDKSRFTEAAAACVSNGERLLDDAEFLVHSEPPSTSFALALIAQEEFAKAFLLFLVSKDVIGWNPLVYRAARDHTCKQLLGFVMSYLNPDSDEEYRRLMEWLANHKEWEKVFAAYQNSTDKAERSRLWARIEEMSEKRGLLPGSVADAINIFRHEKLGRWASSRWCWAEEPVYDEIAKSIAEGKLDRQKQDALYVRLGRNGQVAKTPTQIKTEAKAAMEVADRLRSLAKGLLSHDGIGIEYRKIESAFKTVFADFAEANETEEPSDPALKS
jgi:AbiV family abortive infection protein